MPKMAAGIGKTAYRYTIAVGLAIMEYMIVEETAPEAPRQGLLLSSRYLEGHDRGVKDGHKTCAVLDINPPPRYRVRKR